MSEDLEAAIGAAFQDPEVQSRMAELEKNPDAARKLKEVVEKLKKRYGGPIKWGKRIDTWDKYLAGLGLAGQIGALVGTPVASFIAGATEKAIELIPKIPYAAYYATKTGHVTALPFWATMEAFSLIPYVGVLATFQDTYYKTAMKKLNKEVKQAAVEAGRYAEIKNYGKKWREILSGEQVKAA
jgi:hypothetical protein